MIAQNGVDITFPNNISDDRVNIYYISLKVLLRRRKVSTMVSCKIWSC